MIEKLERKERIQELSPAQTLHKIGFTAGESFCDIGAGTGIFTFSAASLTEESVYAVEISAQLLEFLQKRKQEQNAKNVIIENSISHVPSASCDKALLCTVFHELENTGDMLENIGRVLRPGGTIAIIEFLPQQTPYGPPLEHRWSPQAVVEQLTAHRFEKSDLFYLGENFYVLLATKLT